MSVQIDAVNPHPTVHPVKLARVGDHLLGEFIRLRRSGRVAPDRLHLAGVPSLTVLEDELRRRKLEAAA